MDSQISVSAAREIAVRHVESLRDKLLAVPDDLPADMRAELTPEQFATFKAEYQTRIDAALNEAVQAASRLCEE